MGERTAKAQRRSAKSMRAPIIRFSFDETTDDHYDNFAGGGGAGEAFAMAMEELTGARREADGAINHDAQALAMYGANHPNTKLYQESVWKVDPRAVCGGRRPRSAWFSPDCRHFSGAKGGEPRDQKIRSLAWVMRWWALLVRPDVMFLENVPEFLTWGPLHRTHSGGCRGERGLPCPTKRKTCHFSKPIVERKGEIFRRFVQRLEQLGYVVEWRTLRACDYGAPTTRKRLFMVARCDGKPIVWPKPTHGPAQPAKPAQRSMFESSGLLPYRTAAECINWSIPCPSIFDREKPLAEKTLARIARGIRKYVLGAARPFVVPVNHGGVGRRDHRVHDVEQPLPTITGGQRGGHAVVTPLLTKFQQNSIGQDVREPLDTVMAGATRFGVVAPVMVKAKTHGGGGNDAMPADEPLRTVTTSMRGEFAIITPTLVRTAHGDVDASGKRRGKGHHAVTEPLPTVAASGGDFAVAVPYLVHRSNGERVGQAPRIYDAQDPLGTIVAQGQKHALCTALLTKHYGGNESSAGGTAIDEPVDAITARDHHSLTVASLVRYNGERPGETRGADVAYPLPTQDTSNRYGLVASHLVRFQGTSEAHLDASASSLDEPMPTITAGGWKVAQVAAFLVKYYGAEAGQDQAADEPLDTVTAKPRFGLVTVVIDGEEYVIADIGMRMLEPEELFAAQGFPPDYNIAPVVEKKTRRGKVIRRPLTKTDQIRMCGNSVSPPPAKALIVANLGDAVQMRRAA